MFILITALAAFKKYKLSIIHVYCNVQLIQEKRYGEAYFPYTWKTCDLDAACDSAIPKD